MMLAGCPVGPETVTFEFVHGLEAKAPTYRAITSDPGVIAAARAELARPMGERSLRINGLIAASSGAENPPWKWHFVASEWKLENYNMELCDGQPSYVNDHLEEWLRDVKGYCPWSSRVYREL